jgi:hypothetical protein
MGDVLQSDALNAPPDRPQAYAYYVIAREAAILRDTLDTAQDRAEAESKLADLKTRMTAEEVAAGERMAQDWIDQYGLLDFNFVNE